MYQKKKESLKELITFQDFKKTLAFFVNNKEGHHVVEHYCPTVADSDDE